MRRFFTQGSLEQIAGIQVSGRGFYESSPGKQPVNDNEYMSNADRRLQEMHLGMIRVTQDFSREMVNIYAKNSHIEITADEVYETMARSLMIRSMAMIDTLGNEQRCMACLEDLSDITQNIIDKWRGNEHG